MAALCVCCRGAVGATRCFQAASRREQLRAVKPGGMNPVSGVPWWTGTAIE